MDIQQAKSLDVGTKLILHYGEIGQFNVEVEVIGTPLANGDVPVKILKTTARYRKNARVLASARQLRRLTALDHVASLLSDRFF